MNRKYKYKLFCPSVDEMSILNGLLLSDGSIGADGKSAYFTINTSSNEFANHIFNCFNKSIWSKSNENGPKKSFKFDKRTGKTYTSYRLRTKSNEFFYNLYRLWYPEKKKIIPKNLKLDSLCCLFWYLGDGGISQNNHKFITQRTSHIKISTNSFLEKDVRKIILPQMKFFEPYILYNGIANGIKQPTIMIPRRKIEDFLKYIGDSPFDDYKHKWLIHKYDNSRQFECKYDYNEVIKLYHQNVDFNIISKILNIPTIYITKYFRKNNIPYIINTNKRSVNKFDLNNNFIQTYESIAEACKDNNFNNRGAPSSIHRCCKGGRKSYKKFIWKFK